MAELNSPAQLDSALMNIMSATSIDPGDQAGYELCKQIWQYHPLGGKLVEKPINMALFKPRLNTLDDDPDGRIVRAFEEVWKRLGVTEKIRNLFFVVRCYGAGAIGVGSRRKSSRSAIDLWSLSESDIYINVFDPLNVAGSLVTSQDPNSPDFQSPAEFIRTNGKGWHPSRTQRVFNGAPIYLSYQSSAFGYTGRSVFQRCLYPLRSFLTTMITDNMVAEKAGVLIEKTDQNGSIASGLMAKVTGFKRKMLKNAQVGNVISVGKGDAIESLNLQNIDGAMKTARDNIISAIASGSDTPAELIREEGFAEGWGDGTEDSKTMAQYIDSVRQTIDPVIAFFENIVQHIAWDEDFFNAIRNDLPDEFEGKNYRQVFYHWQSKFTSEWVSLQQRSEDETRKGESELLDKATKLFESVSRHVDPENKSRLIEWCAEVVNSMESFNDIPLVLDYDAIASYTPPAGQERGNEEDHPTEDPE
ncbi:TPA: DUF1073 domain-containing protein [Enterobacter kobei]|nr:DUF1073 domain-containing protein [Enterobacter kobei]